MKKAKCFVATLMAGMLTTAMLAGCGSGEGQKTAGAENTSVDESGKAAGGTETQGAMSADGSGEPAHIVMTFLTGGTDPVDLPMVEEALNEITIPEINVEIELKSLSIFDSYSQYPMWIAGGEQIDLICCAYSGLDSYVDTNMILPLGDLIDQYGPYLKQMDADGLPIFDMTKPNEVYGTATMATYYGRGGGWQIKASALREAGFEYKDWDVVTLDDMDEIFAKLKELYPDSYQGITGALPRAGFSFANDVCGASTASGAVIGVDSTEVVNYFASEEYYNYLKHVRTWYENGYILKDAATTDVALSDYIDNGTFIGYPDEGNASLNVDLENRTGEEWITLMFQDPYMPTMAGASGVYWAVPVTAGNPEAAVKYLNLACENPAVGNLLAWGIEGIHYNFVDEESGVIERTEQGLSNWVSLGLYGNQANYYKVGADYSDQDDIWNEKAMSRRFQTYGYTYDSSNMTNQITAIEAVITEYQAALETGSADFEPTYQEFLDKLEANGINDVIADNQAQLDAWLAQQ